MAQQRSIAVRKAILAEVFWRSSSPVRTVAQEFKLTPQAVQLHVRSLVRSGDLIAHGQRRYRRYELAPRRNDQRHYEIAPALSEDVVWDSFVKPFVADMEESVRDICHYGLTEMVNNVIDHSGASRLRVELRLTSASLRIRVTDDGIGMFQKIANALQLADPRQSLLELSKGKFTTDPSRHTGEGVFFTSRAFDRFSIRSSDLLFAHSTRSDDWLVGIEEKNFSGTRISMGIILPSPRKLEDVFARFSSGPDDHRFARTHVPLKLATYGDENLVSRSSAKRVLSRVERFDEALLDFSGVRSVGQGFADEIFRVFTSAHPEIRIIWINANEQITGMIRRAEAAMHDQETRP